MSRLVKDAPKALAATLEAVASVSTVLSAGFSKRKRQDSSSDSSEDEKPATGVNKPSGWFHERRILSDAEYNAKHLPAQYDAEFRFVNGWFDRGPSGGSSRSSNYPWAPGSGPSSGGGPKPPYPPLMGSGATGSGSNSNWNPRGSGGPPQAPQPPVLSGGSGNAPLGGPSFSGNNPPFRGGGQSSYSGDRFDPYKNPMMNNKRYWKKHLHFCFEFCVSTSPITIISHFFLIAIQCRVL